MVNVRFHKGAARERLIAELSLQGRVSKGIVYGVKSFIETVVSLTKLARIAAVHSLLLVTG
jgi:hypothetical protein